MIAATTLVVFVVAVGGWSTYAPLASAVSATGVVVVGRHNSIVQHPEGGVVAEVVVSEGADVSAGAPMLILDGEKSKRTQRTYREQFAVNTFQIARLKAEMSNLGELKMPSASEGIDLESFTVFSDAQSELFQTRHSALRSKLKVLALQRLQAEDAVRAAEVQLTEVRVRLRSIGRELTSAESLYRSHDIPLDRVASLQRTQSELRAVEAEQNAHAESGRRKADLGAGEIQKALADAKEATATELQRALGERPELREKLDAETFRLEHLVVTAPVAGKVSGLSVHTAGSVLSPGQVVAEIVPQNAPLEIDAHVRPEDIAHVRPGLPVDITLSGLDSQSQPRVSGQVSVVSPDRIVDKMTGQPYFEVRVVCEVRDFRLSGVTPGMGAEVWINSGKRTLVEYLVGPIMKFIHSGLRDT